MPEGYIYCLTNESMPELIKIGETHSVSPYERAEQLHMTGVPTPFNVEFYAKTNDSKKLEKDIHMLLKEYRISESREFFKVSPHTAKLAIAKAMPDINLSDEIIISTSSNTRNPYKKLKDKYDIVEKTVNTYFTSVENSPQYSGFYGYRINRRRDEILELLKMINDGLDSYKCNIENNIINQYLREDNKYVKDTLNNILKKLDTFKALLETRSSDDIKFMKELSSTGQ
jgi:hypothetical protein